MRTATTITLNIDTMVLLQQLSRNLNKPISRIIEELIKEKYENGG